MNIKSIKTAKDFSKFLGCMWKNLGSKETLADYDKRISKEIRLSDNEIAKKYHEQWCNCRDFN